MSLHTEITNSDDIIDSRDIIERLAELQELRDDLEQEAKDIRLRIAELGEQPMLTEAEVSELAGLETTAEDIWTTEDGTELAYSVDWGEDEEADFQALKKLDDEWITG